MIWLDMGGVRGHMKPLEGAVNGKSCLSNLFDFFEKMNEHVDNGDSVDIIYLAFQQAFNRVPCK